MTRRRCSAKCESRCICGIIRMNERFLVEERIEESGELRWYDRLGYVFRESLPTEAEYVFERLKTDV